MSAQAQPRWGRLQAVRGRVLSALGFVFSLLATCFATSFAAPLAMAQPAPVAPVAHVAMPAPPEPSALTVMVFEGAFNLPLWVAQQQGYFAAQGLQISLQPARGSVQVVEALHTGQAQLALMSVDNVLAYAGGQGESAQARAGADLVAFMAGDNGLLSLVARPGVTGVAGLQGLRLAVDAQTTGFAFVAHELLARAGLVASPGPNPGPQQVQMVSAGGTAQRYQQLLQGRFDATLLRPPYERLAQRQGFGVLARGTDAAPHYLGTVGVVRAPWAQAHPQAVMGFLRAYRDALHWLQQPGHRAQAQALLQQQFPALLTTDAALVLADLLAPQGGLNFSMAIDLQALAAVQALRQVHGPGRASSARPGPDGATQRSDQMGRLGQLGQAPPAVPVDLRWWQALQLEAPPGGRAAGCPELTRAAALKPSVRSEAQAPGQGCGGVLCFSTCSEGSE